MLHLFFIYNIIKSIQGKQIYKTIFYALADDFIVFEKRMNMKETWKYVNLFMLLVTNRQANHQSSHFGTRLF